MPSDTLGPSGRRALERRVAELERALQAVLDSGLGQHSHWDETMYHGAGCNLCIRQRAAARLARAALALADAGEEVGGG